MKIPRTLTAYALAASMLVASGSIASAQTTPDGSTAGSTTTAMTDQSGAGMNRAGGDDRVSIGAGWVFWA
jgi:hypothetical protein